MSCVLSSVVGSSSFKIRTIKARILVETERSEAFWLKTAAFRKVNNDSKAYLHRRSSVDEGANKDMVAFDSELLLLSLLEDFEPYFSRYHSGH